MALPQALERVRQSGRDRETVHQCFLTLHTIAENAAQKWNPAGGAKYRCIKQSSGTITKKVTSIPGGKECLLALGFNDAVDNGEPVWKVPQDRACVDKLWDGLALLRVEKDNLASVPVDQDKLAAANKPGGLEGTIRDMLTSPSKLNQILNNPMFRGMISSNPDMVEGMVNGHPEAREMLTIYPEMRTKLEQAMGRPLKLTEGGASPPVAPSAAAHLVSQAAPTGPITANTVQAYVYDITQGMAKNMSMMLVGKQLDLVPHTGIVVFGREYFFGAGAQVCDNPGQSVPVPVAQTIVLGDTSRTRHELEAHINSVLALEHTEANYNLLSHNCNHYANDIAKFLLNGKGVPDSIVNFGQDALSTPQGQNLRGMIEGMEKNMRQGAGGTGMNPFGGSPPPPAGNMNPFGGAVAPAPAPGPTPAPSNSDIVARLMEMGFPEGKCQVAAAGADGDFDLALALVMSTSDS